MNEKVCKDMYNVLINKKKGLVSATLKWVYENNCPFDEKDWYEIFELPFKITNFKFQCLQFQIAQLRYSQQTMSFVN